jgi:hypothetical protein
MAEAGIKASIIAAIVANLMAAFLCSKVGAARDLGSAWPLGKVQEKHHLDSPARAANHCNSDCARLYNAFPLKFDPLRLRLRAKTCEHAQTIIKELS